MAEKICATQQRKDNAHAHTIALESNALAGIYPALNGRASR